MPLHKRHEEFMQSPPSKRSSARPVWQEYKNDGQWTECESKYDGWNKRKEENKRVLAEKQQIWKEQSRLGADGKSTGEIKRRSPSRFTVMDPITAGVVSSASKCLCRLQQGGAACHTTGCANKSSDPHLAADIFKLSAKLIKVTFLSRLEQLVTKNMAIL